MLSPGEQPQAFTLPAVVEGDAETLSLSAYLGEQIVILAFYPGDFNPACGEESDLEELDLFTMQPDVAVIGIAPDTVFSHQAFAAEYDLAMALAADTRGEVADAYGVAFEDEDGQYLAERAVFVVDLDGVVQYAWSTQDRRKVPPIEPIQRVVGDIGGDKAAVSRYRVAHAHYIEGRRAFTSAMGEFEDHDWMVSRTDFDRAREEFTTAAEHFASAGQFVDDDSLSDHFERAGRKANALWQAADWLADAADAFSSGDGEEGTAYRDDAESPLETARDLAKPLDPDDITVEEDEVSIDAAAIEDEEDSTAMDAIRSELDGEPASGVDLELGDVSIDTDEGEDLLEQEGPDTDAARRMREYAGVGMDIDDPDGAEDDQIADALAEVDDGTATDSGADTEKTNRSGRERTAEETTADPQSSPTSADMSDGDERFRGVDDSESTAEETDVTEEEIEEIAEQLQSQNDEPDDGSGESE